MNTTAKSEDPLESAPSVNAASIPAPVAGTERIESIDVLRGVAVLGILALNIQSFAMPGAAYMNPTAYGEFVGVNYWIWLLVHLVGDLKFWSIFSMLFGAGIIIMTSRCEAAGRSAAGLYYRRMGWLIVFGLLHAHLIWYGDILYTYGMCGLVLYLFRKSSPRALLLLSIVPLLVAFLVSLGFGLLLASPDAMEFRDQMKEAWAPTAEQMQGELDAYRGGWLEQLPYRSQSALFFETFLFLISFGWRSAGMILIGMALYKLRVFHATRSTRFYLTLVLVAALVGLPLIGYGVYRNQTVDWSLTYSFYFGSIPNYWGSILVALGWVGIVMLVCKSPVWRRYTGPFAAAGRMALTCYLLQSVIATAIFYGHGLGQFGNFERWQQLLTVVGIWVFLLVFAPLWLRYFRYGPFEWLWRTLSYFRVQPLRKRPAADALDS